MVRCKDCHWYRGAECRRYPPGVFRKASSYYSERWVYKRVDAYTDECGEFKRQALERS